MGVVFSPRVEVEIPPSRALLPPVAGKISVLEAEGAASGTRRAAQGGRHSRRPAIDDSEAGKQNLVKIDRQFMKVREDQIRCKTVISITLSVIELDGKLAKDLFWGAADDRSSGACDIPDLEVT